MHTLGTPVVAYGPRSTTGDGPIDLVAPAPYRSMQVGASTRVASIALYALISIRRGLSVNVLTKFVECGMMGTYEKSCTSSPL